VALGSCNECNARMSGGFDNIEQNSKSPAIACQQVCPFPLGMISLS